MKKGIASTALSIMLCLLSLTACKPNRNQTVYRYPQTELSEVFRIRLITKTVYTSGEMRLYDKGETLDNTVIRCFDTKFQELGGKLACSYTHLKNGGLYVSQNDTKKYRT